MKLLSSFLLLVACVDAFAPRPALTPRSSTELYIGGLFQGFFGKKDAEITDSVYFDVEIDEKAVSVKLLYDVTVKKEGSVSLLRPGVE